jgi:O-antigen ligase
MRSLILLMLALAPTLEFVTKGDRRGFGAILPAQLVLGLEVLGLCALAYIVFVGVRTRFQLVRHAYWIILGALLAVVLCGITVNSTEPGPIIAGSRTYLRALPWFLVPAALMITEKDLRKQLRLLAVIALAQVPIAVYQRVVTRSAGLGGYSGDLTTGTMQISSILSIFLICSACVLLAAYLHKRLALSRFVMLISLLLLPTTINGTKGSLLLLPIGLVATYFVAASPGRRLKHGLLAFSLVGLFAVAFVPAYDYFQSLQAKPKPIGDFITKEGRLEGYLWRGEGLGTTGDAGRGDSISVALAFLKREPATLFFGLGIGNASRSALGDDFWGRYAYTFEPFMKTAFTKLLLELGIFGVILVLCLHWQILRDAIAVARRRQGLASTLAAGWVGVTVVMTISIAYKDITGHASLSFVFWYLSGVIAAERMRHARTSPAESRVIGSELERIPATQPSWRPTLTNRSIR